MTLRLDGRDVAALVFDMDGLLVDSEPVWFDVERAFLARLGHTWTRADADACIGQGTPSTLRVWQRRFGLEVDIERDTAVMVDAVIARAGHIPLKPGALALLDLAARHATPAAVASSSRHRLIDAVLDATDLRSRFAAVVSGQDVARGKPAPDVFVRAAQVLGVAPADTVVLEDAVAGVEGARAAGARVIAVPSTRSPRFAELATHVVQSLSEAAALLAPR
jgi:mannitol-1-/sugar-/sorbitol-6-/2-deoxyglucose-6-phosphatase